ncbi:MAG: O-antigen ligase [Henriciella sp.]|uniref:O-antigen ligase family protein n=1 Tax=Henriciella sp. TaxID=1968823 RepID=UPI003C72EEB8
MPGSLTASQDRAPLLSLALLAEYAAVFVCLVLFSEGLLPRFFASETNPDSTILRLLWLPVYGLVAAGCAWKLPQLFSTAIRLPFLIFLLGLALASTLWSIDPEVTQRRSIAIVATTLAGLYLAARYDWKTLLRLFGVVWLFLALVTFAAGLLMPSLGVMNEIHVGAWRGLWWEKNAMGGHMARAAFLCAFLFLMDSRLRGLWGSGVLLCAALVLLSTSKTALLGMLLGFGILALAGWLRRGVVTAISTLWLGATLAGAGILVLLIEPGLIFELLGRDATLTGRTDIWGALIGAINDRPWFGYGYGAFWGLASEPAYKVRLATEWLVPTAHNGWLETALSLGLVGLVALFLNYLLMLARAVWMATTSWPGVFACGVALQFLLFSVSESIALQQNAIVWVTYVAVAAKVAQTVKKYTGLDEARRREEALLIGRERLAARAGRAPILRIR